MKDVENEVFIALSLLSDTNNCSDCNFVRFSGVRLHCNRLNEGYLTPLPEEKTCKLWKAYEAEYF